MVKRVELCSRIPSVQIVFITTQYPMTTLTFTCETITPMFLAGADGSTPELRPPSIKGALRFWWRAMHGHLDLKTLKEKETEIFGGIDGDTGGRSKVIVRIVSTSLKTISTYSTCLVPHKPNMKANAFIPKQTFDVALRLTSEKEMSLVQLQSLFELVCILGGLGKRVRRGMGSMRIESYQIGTHEKVNYPTSIGLEHILSLLKTFTPHYGIQSNAIYNNFSGRMEAFPWIKSIQIGNPRDDVPMRISNVTHELHANEQNRMQYEASLGHAYKGRFASPLYASVLQTDQNKMAIITTLNTIPDRNKHDRLLQEEFKRKIV